MKYPLQMPYPNKGYDSLSKYKVMILDKWILILNI